MSLAAGSRLGPYEIVSSIGVGGMGEVYSARDTKLDREVAIKVLPEELASDKKRIARFEREARLLASLNHSNIATLHGLENDRGVVFLVMELVEGETLAATIAAGRLSLERTLELFRQIAEALESAHEKGIVHRDLKPANVIVTRDGKAKVLDFGLAKVLEPEGGGGRSDLRTLTREGTQPGAVLGTIAYMSPEQARGQDVDERTDIWSFGCCLFEALTGEAVFLGATASDTIAAILEWEPDWERLAAGIPAGVRTLLRRCLAKDRRRRLHDIADARLELEDPSTDAPATDAVARKSPSATSILSLIVAVAALVTAAWAVLRPDERPARLARTVIPLAPGESAGTDLAISPDGNQIAYAGSRLYHRALDRWDATPIPGSEGARMPFFSPDSQWIGFLLDTRLMKVAVSGGAAVPVTQIAVNARGASWVEDSLVVAPRNSAGLAKVPAEGGVTDTLTTLDVERLEKSHRYPDVLPDGQSVLFSVGTGEIESWDEASIALLSLETGEYRTLLEGGTNPRYSPTGHIVYAREGSLLAVPFDSEALEVRGTPIRVLDGVAMNTSGQAAFSLSSDGALLYAPSAGPSGRRRVVWVDRNGRTERVIEEPRRFANVALSPDGDYLALGVSGANETVWLYDLARGSLSRFTFRFDNAVPKWSPDGGSLVFTSDRDGPFNLYLRGLNGGTPERLTTSDHLQFPGSWSPGGETLLFEEPRPETGYDIWRLELSGDRVPEVLLQETYNERRPYLSPDGRWLSYVSDESARNEVYVQSFPELGSKRQVSLEGGMGQQWSADGTELYFRNGDDLMVVEIASNGELQIGKPRLLFTKKFPAPDRGLGDSYSLYDVAPDGRRFVTFEEEETEPPPTHLNLILNWAEELERFAPTP